jgi:hypothetical protein
MSVLLVPRTGTRENGGKPWRLHGTVPGMVPGTFGTVLYQVLYQVSPDVLGRTTVESAVELS